MPMQHVFRFNYVCTLAKALEHDFVEHGKTQSLDNAIDCYHETIESALPDSQYFCYRDLAQAHHTRFRAHGHEADLDAAVELITKAQRSCKRDGALPQLSSFLGEFLTTRFTLRRQRHDIDAAISALQYCLECADDRESPNSAVYRSSLGNAFFQKFLVYHDLNDLTNAILVQNEALSALPQVHSHRPHAYSLLGAAFSQKFSVTSRFEDIEDAIWAYTHALQCTLTGRHVRATYLLRLGQALYSRFRVTNKEQDMLLAFGHLEEAANDKSSSISSRFESAVLWANVAHKNHILQAAMKAYRLAIELLPQIAWLLIDHKARLQWLSAQSADLCQNAAACALSSGLPEEAVEMLDRGRSIIWNTSQNLRADLSSLSQAHPGLARELQELSLALDFRALHSELGVITEPMQDAQIYRRLADRWHKLLGLVRAQTGFERFLEPLCYAELQSAAAGGFVVIVNASHFRCDAVVVMYSACVQVVPLTELKTEQMQTHANLLNKALQGERDQHWETLLDSRLVDVLRHLWDTLGAPVWQSLLSLGFTGTPRVWWCPTGVLSRLPIHACGLYNGHLTGMADLAVSSYIPTLSALLRAKVSRQCFPPTTPFRLLAIGLNVVPDVPESELPCTLKEMCILRSLPGYDTMTILEGPDATVSRVGDLMPVRDWLHVAAHGILQPASPLESYLLLYDGPLFLSEIAEARLPHAEFAFMSTCHSAKADEAFPDEALHIGGGLLVAGYKGVLATLWSIADEDGPTIAQLFYEHLTRQNRNPDALEAAEALHIATRVLRHKPHTGLWRWVPFVHLGI